MSVINNSALSGASGASAAGAGGYEIARSLRFNVDDASYLSRTPSTAGNRRTWSWSGWIKISDLSEANIFNGGTSGSNDFSIRIENGQLQVQSYTGSWVWRLKTSALFRDPSAWYHFVVAFDSTKSTASDRIKVYVNGIQETTFDTATYPTQDLDSLVNSTNPHYFAYSPAYGDSSFYLADAQFIDGIAASPSDFTETDDNGVLQPKKYEGSYNGSASGTVYSSTITMNGGSAGYGTPASMFNGDETDAGRLISAANGNITWDASSYNLSGTLRVKTQNYRKVTVTHSGGSTTLQATSSTALQWLDFGSLTNITTVVGFADSDGKNTGVISAVEYAGNTLVDGTVAGVNGFHLALSDNSSDAALGYDTSSTSNTTDKGQNFKAVTYTGNGAARTISCGFSPGLVWIKDLTQAHNHNLVDIVRGAPNILSSDTNVAEITNSTDSLTGFVSNGFTLGANTAGTQSYELNKNGNNYVSWSWKAGAAASSNTDGTITSQVSVNQAYGFSIVKYTGTGSSATVGHGLNASPKFLIIKNRDGAHQWAVYSNAIGAGNKLMLDSANGTASTGHFNSTDPTSSVFSVGTTSSVNNSGDDIIAYCWSEVAGFSKFGSYTGNGSSTGPTITTGFKPAFVMIKRTDTSGHHWAMLDSARGTNAELLANLSNAEGSTLSVSFTATGFQVTNTAPDINGSGGNFIYMAFAEDIGNHFEVNNLTASTGDTTPGQNFKAIAYTGTGSSQSITTNFEPGLIWLKSRTNAYHNHLVDSVRGAGQVLWSNRNNAEDTNDSSIVSSISSNGFTLGSGAGVNASGANHIAWVWNAGANSNKTYTVKVVSDGGNKYRFDDFGTSAVTLELAEGSTYVFDQSDSSNSGHPLRFSTTSNGTHGGGSEYTTGVTTTGTPGSAGAKTTIVVAASAPTLYYYCTQHSGMGGQANTNSTAGASNFDGSIQAVVKANQTKGFSIVSFTGNNTEDATVGHGLNATPELVIQKGRTIANYWAVYHAATPSTPHSRLDLTNTATTGSHYWKSFSSTLMTLPDGGTTLNNVNNNGEDYIAYCFAPVAGYSAFGSYTGNGSSTGPVITTGFKTAFVLIKSTSSGDWYIIDSARGNNKILYPNLTNAESTGSLVELTDTGFKIVTSTSNVNANGQTFIYMAFADNLGGEGCDSLVDTPEQRADQTDSGAGGTVVGNYATLNPLNTGSNLALSNGNLRATESGGNYHSSMSTIGVSSGKWYCEMTLVNDRFGFGIGTGDTNMSSWLGQTSTDWVWRKDGHGNAGRHNASDITYSHSTSPGDVIGLMLDLSGSQGILKYSVNGSDKGAMVSNIPIGPTYFITCGDDTSTGTADFHLNFGQRPFVHLVNDINAAPTLSNGAVIAKVASGTFSGQLISGSGNMNFWTSSNGVTWSYLSGGSSASFSNAAWVAIGGSGTSARSISSATSFQYAVYNGGTEFDASSGSAADVSGLTYLPANSYKALNTANLPTPTIADGSKHFDIRTYTGNGVSLSVGGTTYPSAGVTATGTGGVSGISSTYPILHAFDGSSSTYLATNYADISTNPAVLTITFPTGNQPTYSQSVVIEIWSGPNDTVQASINGGSLQSVAKNNWTQHTVASGSGTITELKITRQKSNSNNGGAELRAIIVDGNQLLDDQGAPLSFSPDLVWIKSRSETKHHELYDVFRGPLYPLNPNKTDQEYLTVNSLTAFNVNGFSLGSRADVNNSGQSFVAWTWDGGDLVTNSAYDQTAIWSGMMTSTGSGIEAANPATSGFDGTLTGLGCRVNGNSSMTWTPAGGYAFTGSVIIYCAGDGMPSGNQFTCVHAGGTLDFSSSVTTGTTNTAVNLTNLGITSPITSITIASGVSNPRFSGIEIGGKLLVDAGLIPVGSLNPTPFDQSQTWSNGLTASPSNGLGYAASVFDGSENINRNTNMSASATVTFTPPGTITNVTKLEVKVGAVNTANSVFELNGVNKLSDYNTLVGTGNAAVTDQYVDITSLFVGTSTLTSMKWGYNGSTNYNLIRNIKVNGSLLVDSGVSVTNVPSIASTVRANPSAGFSIVSYTGNSVNNTTIGHGLNTAPQLIITKNRDGAYNWITYSAELAATKVLALDGTYAAFTPSGGYYSNVGSSTYQVVQGSANLTNLNNSGDDYIAYCFAPVEGYSSFGSYTGNGSADGPFVYTGFRPAWILIKDTDASINWRLLDTARNPNNLSQLGLIPNDSSQEVTTNMQMDILSNGFKIKATADINASGNTMVYAAFAENPFQNSRAR